MSRGGFGGGRGGWGGGNRMNQLRDGQNMPWEYDPDLKVDNSPQDLYPKTQVPIALRPTLAEHAAVALYRTLRSRIHDGPLYTVLDRTHAARIDKKGQRSSKLDKHKVTAAAIFDPFEGLPTYSQKYHRQRRKIPRLDTRPYCFEFFPEELWATLDPVKYGKIANGTGVNEAVLKAQAKRKRLQIALNGSKSKVEKRLEDFDNDVNEGDEDENVEDEEEKPDEDAEAAQEEDPEDDEEEDDDYNAENYFDNGEDDYGDEDDVGGGGEDIGWD